MRSACSRASCAAPARSCSPTSEMTWRTPEEPFDDRDGDRSAHARPGRWVRGAPGAAVHAAADGGALHLLRPDGPRGVPLGTGPRRTTPPAHRPRDRDLSLRGRDPPSGQPRDGTTHPGRRGELDDRGPGHRAFGAHAAIRAQDWGRLSGIQIWVALPKRDEEREPAFAHTPADALPVIEDGGARVRLIAGGLYGARSPVD